MAADTSHLQISLKPHFLSLLLEFQLHICRIVWYYPTVFGCSIPLVFSLSPSVYVFGWVIFFSLSCVEYTMSPSKGLFISEYHWAFSLLVFSFDSCNFHLSTEILHLFMHVVPFFSILIWLIPTFDSPLSPILFTVLSLDNEIFCLFCVSWSTGHCVQNSTVFW